MVLDTRIPMMGRTTSFLDTYGKGLQLGQQTRANALAMQGARTDQNMKAAQMLAQGVLNSPDKPRAYQMALGHAKRMGMDVSAFPADYNPDAEAALRMFASPKEATEFERALRNAGIEPGSPEYRRIVMERWGRAPAKPPSGFEATDGGMRPIPGGPADPAYKESIRPEGKPPTGYRWNADRTALERIPGYEMRGETIEVGPDGGITIARGAGLGRRAKNEIEVRELDMRDSLARLERIGVSIDANPEVINMGTVAGRVKRWGVEMADMLGADLSPEDEQYLIDVTAARGDILENLNYTIKAITGAAMTEPEAKRIGATLPGITDSPTVFRAKLDRATEATRMAVARYNYWRHKRLGGTPADVTTLSDMKRLIKERGAELAAKVEAKEMTSDEAAAIFEKEFGI